MITQYFDVNAIENIIEDQNQLDAQINALTAQKEKRYVELDQIVIDALLKVQWKPIYNEKAVYLDFANNVSWHVWFTEEVICADVTYYRFREVPNDFPKIFNYYRQRAQPRLPKETHEWILPMKLYKVLADILNPFLYADKHEQP